MSKTVSEGAEDELLRRIRRRPGGPDLHRCRAHDPAECDYLSGNSLRKYGGLGRL